MAMNKICGCYFNVIAIINSSNKMILMYAWKKSKTYIGIDKFFKKNKTADAKQVCYLKNKNLFQ